MEYKEENFYLVLFKNVLIFLVYLSTAYATSSTKMLEDVQSFGSNTSGPI